MKNKPIVVKSVNALESVYYDIKGILDIINLHKGKTIDDKFIIEFNRLINNKGF